MKSRLLWRRAILLCSLLCAILLTALYLNRQGYVLSASCFPIRLSAYQQGRNEAEQDLAQGHLKVKIYGMPEEWGGPNLFEESLLDNYGIELRRVADCIVTDDIIENTRGYNEIAIPEIEKRYGEGILEQTYQQASAKRAEQFSTK